MSLWSVGGAVLGGGLGAVIGGPVGMIGGASLGASIGSSVDTNNANVKAQKSANEANAALWREQAAYNSPEAQMQRLKAAGLSPQLVYGQVADSKMSSPPTMVAPHRDPVVSREGLAQWQQVQNMQEQNKLLRAQQQQVAAATTGLKLENVYKDYETSQLMRSGALRNDHPVIKSWRFIQDKIQQFNQALDDEARRQGKFKVIYKKGGD